MPGCWVLTPSSVSVLVPLSFGAGLSRPPVPHGLCLELVEEDDFPAVVVAKCHLLLLGIVMNLHRRLPTFLGDEVGNGLAVQQRLLSRGSGPDRGPGAGAMAVVHQDICRLEGGCHPLLVHVASLVLRAPLALEVYKTVEYTKNN